MKQIPALGIGLIEGLTFKGKCYSALAQMLGTRSITERLAHLLLHLVDAYGIKDAKGILIGAAFTHADLAHMVGATRQWVTISLKRLQEQGVVLCRKSQIIVRLPDVLGDMRGGANKSFAAQQISAISAAAAENTAQSDVFGQLIDRDARVSVCGATKARPKMTANGETFATRTCASAGEKERAAMRRQSLHTAAHSQGSLR